MGLKDKLFGRNKENKVKLIEGTEKEMIEEIEEIEKQIGHKIWKIYSGECSFCKHVATIETVSDKKTLEASSYPCSNCGNQFVPRNVTLLYARYPNE